MTPETRPDDSAQTIGDLRLDRAQRRLRRGAEEIRLPKLSYELLLALVRHAPGIVTTDQLLTEVWGNVVVGEETVKQRVSLLRQALGDDPDAPRYIESIRGVGYRLVATVGNEPDNVREAVMPGRSSWLLAAAAIAVVAVVALMMPDRSEDGPYSIAVLPFEDLSPNADRAYFSDGIHDEVTSQLSGIDSFLVASRTSVLPYRNRSLNVKQIADELGVDLVIEGSVRHAEDRVRITVQLIDTNNDRHLWAENYERPLSVDNIFEIQAEVAQNIASALQAELTPEDVAAIRKLPTTSIIAYDLYLLGRYHMLRGNETDLRRAIEYFDQAVATDPQFAQAYAALGQAWNFVGTGYGWLPPAEAFPVAEGYIDKALELGYSNEAVWTAMGDLLTWYRWEWNEAEEAYRRATARDENAVLGYMLLLSVLQRHEEALQMAERVISVWPRDQWARSNAAWRFLSAGETERAIVEATVSLDIDDRVGDAFNARGWAYLALGEEEKALEDFKRHVAVQNRSPSSLASLAHGHARLGQREEALALIEEIKSLREEGFVPPEEIGHVYAALGEVDEAFRWLEEGFSARSRGLIFLGNHRAWENIAGDPRFDALMQRVGLPVEK